MNYDQWKLEAISTRLLYFEESRLCYSDWIHRRMEEFFVEWLLTVRIPNIKNQTGKE